MNVRAHVLISGKVQGVYYRQNTMLTAKGLSLNGWVRNLPDGRVEAVFEGEEQNVKKAVEWCYKGPAKAEVTEVDSKYEEYTGEFSDFIIDQ